MWKYLAIFIVCCLIWGFSLQALLIFAILVIAWVMLTGRKRRAHVMFDCIYALAASGEQFAIIHVYFEAALKFALEHGAKLEEGVQAVNAQDISFPMNIKGTNYLVQFARMSDGNTMLMLTNSDEERRKFRERIGTL